MALVRLLALLLAATASLWRHSFVSTGPATSCGWQGCGAAALHDGPIVELAAVVLRSLSVLLLQLGSAGLGPRTSHSIDVLLVTRLSSAPSPPHTRLVIGLIAAAVALLGLLCRRCETAGLCGGSGGRRPPNAQPLAIRLNS